MAAWGYGLLGPVEVRVDGRALPLPGARQRLLLAVLLVNANRMVPAVRLIDELWGADLPADPRAALRTQVARLRRALGPAAGTWPPSKGATASPSRAAGSTSAGSRTRWPRRPGRTASRPCACWTRPSGCAAARPWVSSRTGPSRWPPRPGWRNCGWPPPNARPSCSCHSGGLKRPSPPWGRSWPSIRNGSKPEACSCWPSTGRPADRSAGHHPVVAPASGHRARAGPVPRPAGDRAGHPAPHGGDAG